MTKVWSHGSCWKIETRVSRGGAWCGGWGGLSGRRRGRRSRTWMASPRCASSCAGWARHCGRTSSRSPASCTRRASPPCGCGCGPAQRTQDQIVGQIDAHQRLSHLRTIAMCNRPHFFHRPFAGHSPPLQFAIWITPQQNRVKSCNSKQLVLYNSSYWFTHCVNIERGC